MSDEPAWHDVVEAAKQNRLGVEEGAPVAKGDPVAELRSRGFAPVFVDRAVENSVIKVADEDGFVTKYELAEDTEGHDIAEYDSPEDRAEKTTETKSQEEDALEAFETAIKFMCGRLGSSLYFNQSSPSSAHGSWLCRHHRQCSPASYSSNVASEMLSMEALMSERTVSSVMSSNSFVSSSGPISPT